VCVSCNPTGTPATSEAYLAGNLLTTPAPERNAFLTRNLSEDGSRVFFQTKEALVPQDTNAQSDVYEWERDGAGSCDPASAGFSESDGGCLYLISTGQSDDQSYFGDASATGDDVFFFTRQPLVGQDQDENDDLYDARVEGGIAAQNPTPSVPCAGEACREAPGVPSVFGVPSSTAVTGNDNLLPPTPPAGQKVLTRAQKLAGALRACRKKARKRKRDKCEAQARHRYGPGTKRGAKRGTSPKGSPVPQSAGRKRRR